MKTKAIHIIFVFALIFGLCLSVSAEENVLSEHELAFLELINEARANPLETASSMGMRPDRILRDFPEMQDILTEGLPALTYHKNLYEAARAHTEDMFEEGYYSHDSLDGRTYEDRITATGYLPLATGESLGLLGFSNFIDPSESVRAMFEKMFCNELDPSSTEQWNILNPEFTQAGIALGTGTLYLDGYIFNVYMVTCDFGSRADVTGLQLLNLINQARANPLETAAALGMDTEQLIAEYPWLSEIMTNGLPPLTFNARLYSAARGHTLDMLKEGYYSNDSLDGRTHEDRIRESGYEAVESGEAVGYACQRIYEKPCEAAAIFLKRIFITDLKDPEPGEMTILNPLLKEAGIAIAEGTSVPLGGICGDEVALLTADFGAAETAGIFLMGVTYVDENDNGLYDAGEGAPAVVTVNGPDDMIFSLHSDGTGYFSMPLDDKPGEYVIIALMADGRAFTRSVEIDGTSRAVFIGAPTTEDTLDNG